MIYEWPIVALEAIRKLYPRKVSKKAEMIALAKALQRISDGEVDGSHRTIEESISYMRERIAEAADILSPREEKYIPHLATYLNQRRYLTPTLPPPANLEDAISILACYPTVTEVDIKAHMPVLRVLDEHCRYLQATHGGNAAASYIRTRTIRYAECVRRWPESEMQFVPSPLKWFTERRYEQDEKWWVRTTANGFQGERDQISRLLQ